MAETKKKMTGMERFIRGIEIVGNKLPHPFWLFVWLMFIVLILSFLLSKAGVSVTYMAAKAGSEPVETTVMVENLLSKAQLQNFFVNFIKNYINFAPLGLIMVMTLGISLIEQPGLISAFMRKTILGAPSYLVTATLAFIGINANLASDAGIIFTPAIGGAIFKALGRNPWVGIITGFAAATGGFTANLFVAGTDGLLAGITESVVKGIGLDAPTHVLINWYFMMAATVVLTIVTTVITEKFTVKLLGDNTAKKDPTYLKEHEVKPHESRGLRFAGITLLVYVALVLVLTVPKNAFFRSASGTILPSSPFLSSVVPLLFFLFFFVGSAYGVGAGTIKKAEDVPKYMQKGMGGLLSFLVVALPAAMFIQLFNDSKLTTILAVKGGQLIEAWGLGGVPLIVMFVLLVCFVNLFMISGSAKWLILAPIFVPMFAQVGFAPALTQVAYRAGDSSTNIISPLSYYLPVIIGLLEQYKPEGQEGKIGIGSVISYSLPYSIAYILMFLVMLIVWYVFKLPLGPGAATVL